MQEKRVTFNPQRGTWGRWEEFSGNEGTYTHTSNTVIDGEFGWIANGGSVEIGWEWKSFSTVDNRSWLEDLQTGLGVYGLSSGVKENLLDLAKASDPSVEKLKYVKYENRVGQGFNVVSAAISIGLAVDYYERGGTYNSVWMKTTLDLGMGYIGSQCGWQGLGIGIVYFLLDESGVFGGWGDPLRTPLR